MRSWDYTYESLCVCEIYKVCVRKRVTKGGCNCCVKHDFIDGHVCACIYAFVYACIFTFAYGHVQLCPLTFDHLLTSPFVHIKGLAINIKKNIV